MKFQVIVTALAVPHVCGFSTLLKNRHGSVPFTSQAVRRASLSSSSLAAYPPRKNRQNGNNKNQSEDDEDFDPLFDEPKGKRGDANNWIEKSSPIGIGKLSDTSASSGKKPTETDGNYDLGINGESFQTGKLSNRMHDTLMSVALKRFPPGTTSLPSELDDVYKLYAMDITAKEAVKAALDQNGMELSLINEDDPQSQDEGMWGDVGSVRLYDIKTGKLEDEMYECLDDAVEKGDWIPGQSFSFIVRNVPAKLQEMDVSDLLDSLDPEGKFRAEAKEKGITMPDEDIASLKDLGKDCDRRTNVAPMETYTKETVYKGNESMGYDIIKRSDLLPSSRNSDGTENNEVLMHVMDSMVNHGCLVVDLSDGGLSSLESRTMAKMWEVTSSFYDSIENDANLMQTLPGMKVEEETGSPNAVTGFLSTEGGRMKFLETRILRNDKNGENYDIIPSEVSQIIGEEGVATLIESFNQLCSIGKDVVRVAIAASNMEYDGFLGESFNGEKKESSDLPFISGLTFEEEEVSGIEMTDEEMFINAEKLSSAAALNLAVDLIDDGRNLDTNDSQGSVNMSPHRLCKYMENSSPESKDIQKETFGAHTDTSFVTIVPVAFVSGLEVFDEAANKWFRPELLAREKWEKECKERGLDPTSQTETVTGTNDETDEEVKIPWHSRYVCLMPGELLQVCSRNEVPSAVHRVVSSSEEGARISAPVLLRARSGMSMDVEKYFGNKENLGSLLAECDDMKMQQIHDKLQPSSFRS